MGKTGMNTFKHKMMEVGAEAGKRIEIRSVYKPESW